MVLFWVSIRKECMMVMTLASWKKKLQLFAMLKKSENNVMVVRANSYEKRRFLTIP